MKFITRFFALIGLLITLLFAIGAFTYYKNVRPKVEFPEQFVLTFNLEDAYPEDVNLTLLARFFGAKEQPFIGLIQALEKARKDERVRGIVLRLGATEFGAAQLEELRAALQRFKESEKQIFAYATDLSLAASGRTQLYIGSLANTLMLQNYSPVSIEGIQIDQPFFKELLNTLDVNVQILTRSEYKTAMDALTKNSFTEANRESLTLLLERIYSHHLDMIGKGREINTADINAAVKGAAIMSDQDALRLNLIDAVGSLSDFRAEVRKRAGLLAGNDDENAGRPIDEVFVDMRDYIAAPDATTTKAAPLKRIALITGVGAIVEEAEPSSLIGQQQVLSAEDIRMQLEKAAFDDTIDAIILRLDTPGGMATASETVRGAIEIAKKKGKKVYASFGNVSASGGYWIAAACDKIFASNTTITGSIGVIFGKISFGKALENLSVNVDQIKIGENGSLLSLFEKFDDKQLEAVNRYLDYTYDTFKKIVAQGRGLDLLTVEEIAKGRVWSGFDAKNIGLIDQIGGIYDTIQVLKVDLGLQPSDVIELVLVPESRSPFDVFKSLSKELSDVHGVLCGLANFSGILKCCDNSKMTVLEPSLTKIK